MRSLERVDAILARILTTRKFLNYQHEIKAFAGLDYKAQVADAVKKARESSINAWAAALSMAERAYSDEVPAGVLPEVFYKTIAEQELVKVGMCPPHWKVPYDCERCGFVAVSETFDGTGESCPFCGIIAAKKES